MTGLRTNGSGQAVLVGPGTRRGSHTRCYLRRRQRRMSRLHRPTRALGKKVWDAQCVFRMREGPEGHAHGFAGTQRMEDQVTGCSWCRIPLGGQSRWPLCFVMRDKQGAHQDWKAEERRTERTQLRCLHQSQYNDGERQCSLVKAVNHGRKNEILVQLSVR